MRERPCEPKPPELRRFEPTKGAFEDTAAAQVERLADRWFAQEAFRRHTGGLLAGGPEGRRIGIERSQGRLRDTCAAGGLLRLSVQRLYEPWATGSTARARRS